MRFWLDRGVDGFRMDVIHQLFKDAQLRDDPPNPDYNPKTDNPYDSLIHKYSGYQPEVHKLIRGFRQVIDEYDERVLIGEIQYFASPDDLRAFYGDGDELHVPFNFWLILLNWNMLVLREFVNAYDAVVPSFGFPNYVLGNHDVRRVATRIGETNARLAAMLLLTLRGTSFIYYGDELGMQDVEINEDQVQDVRGVNVAGHSRDPVRTPMQWDASDYAGFSDVETWLPVADDYANRNVESATQNPHSILNLYRQLIQIRKKNRALAVGSYRLLSSDHQSCWVYVRETDENSVLIALNFSAEAQTLRLPEFETGRIALSTLSDRADRNETVDLRALNLRPYEGSIIELPASAT
jgi:alpha-glucosidase